MATDLGTDVSTYVENEDGELDLDPLFREIEGPVVVAESVGRGFETEPGELPWSEEDGADIGQLLNADLSRAELLAVATELEADARRDERVESIAVEHTFDEATNTLTISADGTTADGPFRLVLAHDELSVKVLEVQT